MRARSVGMARFTDGGRRSWRGSAICALTFASMVALGPAARAQSVSGSGSASSLCGPYVASSPLFEQPLAQSSHGECVEPSTGFLASINDASCSWFMGRDRWRTDGVTTTSYFGSSYQGGQASSSSDLFFQASDIVFTNTLDPGDTSPFLATANFLFRLYDPPTVGLSNCAPDNPLASAYFYFGAPGGPASGTFTRRGADPLTVLGAFVAYPNDFTWARGTAGGFVAPIVANSLFVQVQHQVSVLYCDRPPAAIGRAEVRLEVALPCGEPVFDLPPGYTVNSAQLGIVDNVRSGCTLEATLKVTKDTALGTVRLDWVGASPSTVLRAEDPQFTVNAATLVDQQPVSSFDDPVLGDGRNYFYLVQ